MDMMEKMEEGFEKYLESPEYDYASEIMFLVARSAFITGYGVGRESMGGMKVVKGRKSRDQGPKNKN